MIRKMPGVSLRSGRARTGAWLAAELGRADRTKGFLAASTFWEAMVSCVVAALSACSPYRCLGERGFALLTGRWRTLQHITASPSKIGDIARAALILTNFEHGCIKWISLGSFHCRRFSTRIDDGLAGAHFATSGSLVRPVHGLTLGGADVVRLPRIDVGKERLWVRLS